jgi:hypothetical protein
VKVVPLGLNSLTVQPVSNRVIATNSMDTDVNRCLWGRGAGGSSKAQDVRSKGWHADFTVDMLSRVTETRSENPRITCTLTSGANALRITAQGIMIGREGDCDIVLEDPRASRRHTLVRLVAAGVEVVPMGRLATEVNGQAITRPTLVVTSDILTMPGFTGTVSIIEVGAPVAPAIRTILRSQNGDSFRIASSPFVLGGAATDDLIIAHWPPSAVVIDVPRDEPHIEAKVEGVLLNGQPIAVGDVLAVNGDATFALAGDWFRFEQARSAGTTIAFAGVPVPRRVVIELLPRGGRAVFTMGDADYTVYLADRRLDFLVTLLQPPTGNPGDYIHDDVVRGKVWPRSDGISRQEINMLISRCRRDLVAAGLPGGRLIERAPGGGGTRFVLALNAEVVIS